MSHFAVEFGLNFVEKSEGNSFRDNTIYFNDSKSMLKALKYGKISKAYMNENIIDIIVSSTADDIFEIDTTDSKEILISMLMSKNNLFLVEAINAIFENIPNNELIEIAKKYEKFNVSY